ncbi:MAG TPA: tetratricopeptide repeat protein [Bacteroidales bacterium]|nr:tetratricopeptide repeat protein [Bacteroidales bacterium]
MKKNTLRFLLISIFIFLSYSNSLTLDYALDDRLVIFENDYTLKGFQGVKDIFTKDSFSGYFGHSKNLVAGGRYRPVSQLSFVVEYETFGHDLKEKVGFNRDQKNEKLFEDSILPFVSHLVNILLYILLCFLILKTLQIVFEKYENDKWYLSIPFIATLLFALHPIHTEAVTNIKGRDEILSMLGAVLTLWCSLKYVKTHRYFWLILSLISFVFALFSKENAITYLAVIPLAIYFLNTKKTAKDYILTLIPLALASIFFLIIRSKVLGAFMASEVDPNILNNPFVNATFFEKIATVLLTWGIYLKLMIFPHPLTHDYYPLQIEITNFSNPIVWIILISVIFVIVYAIKTVSRKKIISFAILFFIITFSITSNLLYSVGTLMNERFVFVPLLGFSIVCAYLFLLLMKNKESKKNSSRNLAFTILIPVMLFYMGKTFARNFTWENDITLFTHDVEISENSIKCNISAGGSYIKLYHENKKEKNLKLAKKYLDKALLLDPTSYNALLLSGEYYFLKGEYETSYQIYANLAKNNPEDPIAAQNAAIVMTKWKGNQLDEIADMIIRKEIPKAFENINKILQENPNNPDALSLKGKIFGQGLFQMDSARFYFNKALQINPNHANSLENMGVSYAIQGQLEKALTYLLKANQTNPNSESVKKNIELVKKQMSK